MFYNWFDHRLIEAWLKARLRAELHGQRAAPANDRPLERLEVPVIEALPDVLRESVERAPVHPLDEPAPRGDGDRRRR